MSEKIFETLKSEGWIRETHLLLGKPIVKWLKEGDEITEKNLKHIIELASMETKK